MSKLHSVSRKLARLAPGAKCPLSGILVLSAATAALTSTGCGFTHLHIRADKAPADFRGLLWQYDSPSADIRTVHFSPDGERILVYSPYACRVLDTDSGLPLSVFENGGELKRPLDYLGGALFVVHYYLFLGNPPGMGNAKNAPVQQEPERKPGWRQNAMLVCAGDSQRAYFIDSSLRLRTWLLDTGRLAEPPTPITLDAHERIFRIGPSGKVFVVEDFGDKSWWLRERTGGWSRQLPEDRRVSFASDGRSAFIVEPGSIQVIDSASGHVLREIQVPSSSRKLISPDGKWLLLEEIENSHSLPETRLVRVLDPRSGQVVQEFPIQSAGIKGAMIGWSPSANLAAYFQSLGDIHSRKWEVLLVDLAEGKEVHRVSMGPGERMMDFSSDGQYVVTHVSGLRIRLYKVAHCEPNRTQDAG